MPAGRHRTSANAPDKATVSLNERILKECHDLYIDDEKGSLETCYEMPRCRLLGFYEDPRIFVRPIWFFNSQEILICNENANKIKKPQSSKGRQRQALNTEISTNEVTNLHLCCLIINRSGALNNLGTKEILRWQNPLINMLS